MKRLWLVAVLGCGAACAGLGEVLPTEPPGEPTEPPGAPGEPRLLGSDRWRVPQRSTTLAWRGDQLVTVADDLLLVVEPDGTVHREPLPAKAVAWAAHGTDIVIGVEGGDLLRIGDGHRFDGDHGRIVAVDFAPDGSAIAAVGEPPRPAPPQGHHVTYRDRAWVRTWTAGGEPVGAWPLDDCVPRGLVHLGTTLLVACRSDTAVLDPVSGPLDRADHPANEVVRSADGEFAATEGLRGCAVWRPGRRRPDRIVDGTGRCVAITSSGAVAVARATEVAVEGGPTLELTAEALAVSPDGRELAGFAGTVVWRRDVAEGGAAQPDGDAHRALVSAVASSLDGRYVVSGSMDGEVRRWDAASGRVLDRWTWDGRERRIDGVAIAGDRVAAAVGDRVRAFDDGEEWTTPRSVWALSSDGEALYAHIRDQRYRLDPHGALVPVAPRFAPTGPYGAFPIPVTAASWGPTGFVSGHDDGTVRTWSIGP